MRFFEIKTYATADLDILKGIQNNSCADWYIRDLS